jgi:hypothetical protein
MFIQILAIIGSVLGFIAITLSVAAGLYYFSEIIEENLQFTKRFLKKALIIISILLILLYLFDSFPFKLICFTLFTNYIYNLNLKKFPDIQLSDPIFILSCLLAFLNHYLWFNNFNNPYIPSIDERLDPNFIAPYYPSFTEIASFFGICIWMFPFALFISISSNENGLPISISTTNENSNNFNQNQKKNINLLRSIINKFLIYVDQLSSIIGINFKFTKPNDQSNPNQLYI